MKVFVSYSFRNENAWIEHYVIPLIECFGHEPVTGRILDGGPLDEEVKKKIRQSRRVLCFVTRARPQFDQNGSTVGHDPPDWVRDELMIARGADRETIEFRETGVRYGGASPFRAYWEFDRDNLPKLLLDLAQRLSDWPVGPLQFRLSVPEQFKPEVQQAAHAGTLRARCIAMDDEQIESNEELKVQIRDGQMIVPFWIKPKPNLSIEIEVTLGARVLACRGISPAVREAQLSLV